MEVKAGYKRTEMGEFPSDWAIANFPDYVWFQEGPGLRKWQFQNKGLKVINVTNLTNDGYLDLELTDRHISWEVFEKTYRHFKIDEKDIVVASSGNSYCKTALVRVQDLPLLMNTSVIRFKPKNGLSEKYLLVFLKSPYFKKQIDLMITGGAQPNFGPAHLKKVLLPIPQNESEQQAIANALSDADALIESLEQLIEKKRQIKQGVMQELLTGKRRLPGFSGEWEWGKLGELVQTIPGGIYGIEKKVAGLVGAKVATTAHISDEDEWNGKEMAERYFTSTQLEGYLVKTNDLVVVKSSGSAASIKSGKIGLVTEKEANKFVFTNFLMVLRPKNIYSKFLYSYLISHNVKKLLPSLVEASTYPNIRRDEYLAIQIPVPPLNEQKEIAAFLTEQTIEMEALAEKLAKQKQIKQGMMQELLTGRVRLV